MKAVLVFCEGRHDVEELPSARCGGKVDRKALKRGWPTRGYRSGQ